MVKKHPFIAFALVVGILVATAIAFIQSAAFVRMVKGVVAYYLPKGTGIDFDFTEFSVALIPPGVSIKEPQLTVRENNVLKLPPGSKVVAERLDLQFRTLQILSRGVTIHRVALVGGDVTLNLDIEELIKSDTQPAITWRDILRARANIVALENTRVKLNLTNPDIRAEVEISSLELSKWAGELKEGAGISANVRLEKVSGSLPKEWNLPNIVTSLEGLELSATAGPFETKIEKLQLRASGVSSEVSGAIKGDLLDPSKSLAFQGEAGVEGAVSSILELAPMAKKI